MAHPSRSTSTLNRALLVDVAPPNGDFIAAEATATIGRGGPILVSLWVEARPLDR